MFKKQEPMITMTVDQLAALVDARIAERESQAAQRAAEQAKAPVVQPVEPAIHFPAPDPERDEAFLKILDENHGDAAKTVDAIYLNVHPSSPNKQLLEHLDRWRKDPVTGSPLYNRDVFGMINPHAEAQALASHLAHLDKLRKSPTVAEQVAQRTKFDMDSVANARAWHEARPLSYFTDEELRAEMTRRAKGVPV